MYIHTYMSTYMMYGMVYVFIRWACLPLYTGGQERILLVLLYYSSSQRFQTGSLLELCASHATAILILLFLPLMAVGYRAHDHEQIFFSVNTRDLDLGPMLAQQTLSASMSSSENLGQFHEEKNHTEGKIFLNKYGVKPFMCSMYGLGQQMSLSYLCMCIISKDLYIHIYTLIYTYK